MRSGRSLPHLSTPGNHGRSPQGLLPGELWVCVRFSLWSAESRQHSGQQKQRPRNIQTHTRVCCCLTLMAGEKGHSASFNLPTDKGFVAHASLLLPHQETQRLLTTAVPAEHKKFCKALTKFSMLAVNHPQNFNSGNMEKGRKRCFWGQASIILPKANPGSYFESGKCLAPRQDMGFPGGSAGTESSCNAGDLGSIPGLGRSPGEGKG